MAEAAKWYVIHTYSGYENKVKTDLEKTVKNRAVTLPSQSVFRNGEIKMSNEIKKH